MEHTEAQLHLIGLATGRLPAPLRTAVEQHVDGCDECSSVLETMQILAQLRPDQARALREDHRSADDLAMLAANDPGLDPTLRSEIRSHLRACPLCAFELDLAERALTARPARARRLRSLFTTPAGSIAVGRVAVAALIILMAYPTYRGLTGPLGPTTADSGAVLATGAGTRLVVLPAARRGTPEDVLVRAPHGPGLQPVALEFDLAMVPEGTSARLRFVLMASGSQTVWTLDVDGEDVWNAELRMISVLVPNAVLQQGSYILQLQIGRHEDAIAAAFPFRVGF